VRTRFRGLAVLLLLGLLVLLPFSHASAGPTYPPGTPTAAPTTQPTTTPSVEVDVCIGIEGRVDGEFVEGQATEQGQVRVFGSAGAADSLDTVNVFAEPGHVSIGSTQANEDGSFSAVFTLPDGLEPGSYRVETDSETCSESAVLSVSGVAGAAGSGNDDDDTSVLGDAIGRGNLPTTGSNILDLVLLALALIAIGTVIRWLVKRRQAEGRAVGFSRRTWPVPALPAPSVPLIDTSDFVVFSAKRSAAIRSAKPKKDDAEPHSDWS
jgi:hypothetical protein